MSSVARLFIDPGESIRFRVSDVEWQDVRPEPKAQHSLNGLPNGHTNGDEPENDIDPIHKAGYKIYATIQDTGLGIVSWWDGGADEEGDEAMEEG